jgi:Tol biopolymer transport system component
MPAIKSVIPAQAPYGAKIVIGGTGFGSTLKAQKVYFNNTLANIETLTDTTILTRVPLEATDGPVKVISQGDTLLGPSFSVDTTKSLFLSIKSIDPTEGNTGDNVRISGTGFRSNLNENKVFFNTVQAAVLSASDTVITTTVPVDAQTGPVSVVTTQDTVVGPVFTVTTHTITSISPESGPVGTTVTISGSGFHSNASENTVTFNGVEAPVETVSENELQVVVPEGATTGPVDVTIDGLTVEGPVFAVEILQKPKILQVTVETSGDQIDPDGYTLSVTGSDDRLVKPNDKVQYGNLFADQLQAGLSGVAPNCNVEGQNPRSLVLDSDTTVTTFSISCIKPNQPPIASFTASCTNLNCTFDASGSTDSDGTIASYNWDFGNGLKNSGQPVKHSYEVPGTYTVQLKVTDDDGASDTVTDQVTVTIPEITGISPVTGPVGTYVTISGSGFSNILSENVVTFNGAEAAIETASETEIHAIVPEGATTGPVGVSVNGYLVTGPTFTVKQPKSLQVAVQTVGSAQDDSYTLSVSGQNDAIVSATDNVTYTGIYEDNVQVTLGDVAPNCRVAETNPRNVALSADVTTNITFNVDCTIDLRGKIVFQSDASGNSDIYALDSNSSLPMPITNTSDVFETGPAISPDGLQIAFAANTGSGSHIFIMDTDGSNLKQLTKSDYNTSPAWSPDGSRIVFEKDPGTEISDLYIIDVDGSNLTQITKVDSYSANSPDWSPDGSRIIYYSNEDGDNEIFTIHPDGTNKKQITNNTVEDTDPEWSPDGSKIAFVRVVKSGQKIHIMNADGSGVYEMTPSTGSESSPTWSPDGTLVAYARYIDGNSNINIYSLQYNDIMQSNYTPSFDTSPHWNFK